MHFAFGNQRPEPFSTALASVLCLCRHVLCVGHVSRSGQWTESLPSQWPSGPPRQRRRVPRMIAPGQTPTSPASPTRAEDFWEDEVEGLDDGLYSGYGRRPRSRSSLASRHSCPLVMGAPVAPPEPVQATTTPRFRGTPPSPPEFEPDRDKDPQAFRRWVDRVCRWALRISHYAPQSEATLTFLDSLRGEAALVVQNAPLETCFPMAA